LGRGLEKGKRKEIAVLKERGKAPMGGSKKRGFRTHP